MWLETVVIDILRVDELRPANGTLDGLVVLFIAPRMPPKLIRRARKTPPYLIDISNDLAHSIAHQPLPSLRVIVIGEYRFWVEIREDRSKIWPLTEAICDTKQAEDIAEYLNRKDWQFVTPNYELELGKRLQASSFKNYTACMMGRRVPR